MVNITSPKDVFRSFLEELFTIPSLSPMHFSRFVERSLLSVLIMFTAVQELDISYFAAAHGGRN